jgi:hypothetical protein
MIIYEGIYAAAVGANDVYVQERLNLPVYMVDALDPRTDTHFFDGSWVDLICPFVEIVYANKSELAFAPLLAVAAGVANVITTWGFWDSLNSRAAGICLALRRDSGETAEPGFPWPDPENDPAVNEDYVPPA